MFGARIFAAVKEVRNLRFERARKHTQKEHQAQYRQRRFGEEKPVSSGVAGTMDRCGLGDAYREILARVDAGEDRVTVTDEIIARIRAT